MTTCSAGSLVVGEQLAGSAPYAVAWLALEQEGPWGAKAFTASHLDPEVGGALEAAAGAHDVRPALIRTPGRHADTHLTSAPRRVLLAHTRPGATWLLSGAVADPASLLRLDWAALRAGDRDAVRRSVAGLTPADGQHLLVCTNGTRDVCCATLGRPVALGAATARPARVWEVTHTSGHRFAPTAVLLPAGTLHGRLDVASAVALLDAAGRSETVLAGSRGRTTWSAPGQVAELAVRTETSETGLDALAVDTVHDVGDHAWSVAVGHRDGRRWTVTVTSAEAGVDRSESCAKGPVPLRRWTTTVTLHHETPWPQGRSG